MKRIIFALLALCMIPASFFGCSAKKESVDLSSYSFVNVEWERDTESCVETIYFNDDGNCGYYCGCGEPVNNDDLCEGYTFDPDTQTIRLNFSSAPLGTVKNITVKSCDGETLVLDFDGDVRTFKKAVEYDPEFHEDTIEYNGSAYLYLEFPADIFYYDLAESVDYEEDEYLPIPHEKWDLVYYNGDLFVLSSQTEEAVAYYADKSNYSWAVVVDDPEGEISQTYSLTLNAEESDYVYSMEDRDMTDTLAFDDIELFGTLVKTSDDGLISGITSLAYCDGIWYWRSEVIDEDTEGWPEFVVPLPEAVSDQITKLHKITADGNK